MRVTIAGTAGTVLDFDPASENVLVPTKRDERAAALAVLVGALDVVAGLYCNLTPRESVDVNVRQPGDDVAPAVGTIAV